MSNVQFAKDWVVDLFGLSKDALHLYVGLTVFLLVALFGRLPLRDMRPLAAVLLVAALGEVVDLVDASIGGRALGWRESWHDMRNTCIWPLVIFTLARLGALRT